MKGALLTNLGSTKSADPKDVKEYLDEFLMDERALDLPYWLRSLVVRGIILKTRPPKTAANYKRVWWEEGSPLIVISERFKQKVAKELDLPVAMGMRYGTPSIKSGIEELVQKGVDEILLVPLYPQYTMSTIETAVEKAKSVAAESFPKVKFDVLPPFYKNPAYIDVLAKSVQEHLDKTDFDQLLFSYHGIPTRHERKTNFKDESGRKITYRDQCITTSKLVAKKLGLKEEQFMTSFQSRLGFDPWIKPYTADTFKKLPGQGIKNLAVATPAFVADCLETLDEISREGRETFEESGGKEFTFIPCLNDRKDWVKVMAGWIEHWAKDHL